VVLLELLLELLRIDVFEFQVAALLLVVLVRAGDLAAVFGRRVTGARTAILRLRTVPGGGAGGLSGVWLAFARALTLRAGFGVGRRLALARVATLALILVWLLVGLAGLIALAGVRLAIVHRVALLGLGIAGLRRAIAWL